ncbi:MULTISPECIES: hypothetical protein [unclassified Streptomyces]|uniref:hypothetical protein n=1 Tax=unclassified Streptomyces TaxID=2593676 RepID=UPI0011A1819B|nr:hypothetical protein [Streptomyces sp. BK340]TVZ84142.1 hypothetical protein FB157_12166 [Streptomyces sp. BK340]
MNDRSHSGTQQSQDSRGTDLALLGIYLNDHLLGATAGTERARHLVRSTHDSALAEALGPVSAEIDQDRKALLGIMHNLGVPVRRYKICAGWTAEKMARLKGNGRFVRRSPLSTFLELEALRTAVEGKVAGWETLRGLAPSEKRLDAQQLDTLLERAHRQQDVVEEWHARKAGTTLRKG